MALNEIPMSRLLKLAHKFNCFYLSGLHKNDCRPFIVEGHQVGLVRPEVTQQLQRYPEVFHVQPDVVELNPAFRDYTERSTKVETVLTDCRVANLFVALKGWRDECYEVRDVFSSESLLKMDRSATCLFGIRNYGVDINGYVMDPVKGLCIWLQRRSPTKQTWPGMWDNMVHSPVHHSEALKSAQTNLLVHRSLATYMGSHFPFVYQTYKCYQIF